LFTTVHGEKMRKHKLLYSIEDTKAEIHQGKTKVYELIGAGILDARKAGKSTRVTGESIERYVESLPRATIRTRQKGAVAASPAAPRRFNRTH
jgi:hypothetical protein